MNTKLKIPKATESSFIGAGINTLIGLKMYPDRGSIIEDLLTYKTYKNEKDVSDSYKAIYNEWKNIKKKIDNL